VRMTTAPPEAGWRQPIRGDGAPPADNAISASTPVRCRVCFGPLPRIDRPSFARDRRMERAQATRAALAQRSLNGRGRCVRSFICASRACASSSLARRRPTSQGVERWPIGFLRGGWATPAPSICASHSRGHARLIADRHGPLAFGAIKPGKSGLSRPSIRGRRGGACQRERDKNCLFPQRTVETRLLVLRERCTQTNSAWLIQR